MDSDHNGVPDMVLFDAEGDGEFKKLAEGPEVEARILEGAQKVAFLLNAAEIAADALDEHLKELDIRIRNARKELNARR